MLVTIHSSRPIGGSITAPPSKSMAHRAVLCAALATGSSHITNLEFSKDISATLAAAGQLCARVTTGPADAVVEGLGRFAPLTAPVDCCESGSTLRFLIPIASLTGQEVTFTGRGRLMERPQSVYETLPRAFWAFIILSVSSMRVGMNRRAMLIIIASSCFCLIVIFPFLLTRTTPSVTAPCA